MRGCWLSVLKKAPEAGSIDLIWRESLESFTSHQSGDVRHQAKVSAGGGGGVGGREGEEAEGGVHRRHNLQLQTETRLCLCSLPGETQAEVPPPPLTQSVFEQFKS